MLAALTLCNLWRLLQLLLSVVFFPAGSQHMHKLQEAAEDSKGNLHRFLEVSLCGSFISLHQSSVNSVLQILAP